jgi:hypothetical protein
MARAAAEEAYARALRAESRLDTLLACAAKMAEQPTLRSGRLWLKTLYEGLT